VGDLEQLRLESASALQDFACMCLQQARTLRHALHSDHGIGGLHARPAPVGGSQAPYACWAAPQLTSRMQQGPVTCCP
jgi:hypothetical protein